MKYDTAGNEILKPIANCDCNSTAGCEKCMSFKGEYSRFKGNNLSIFYIN